MCVCVCVWGGGGGGGGGRPVSCEHIGSVNDEILLCILSCFLSSSSSKFEWRAFSFTIHLVVQLQFLWSGGPGEFPLDYCWFDLVLDRGRSQEVI